MKERPEIDSIEKDIDKLVIEMLHSFREWKKSIEFIEHQCPLHDYKEVKANGYRSIYRINTLAVERINKTLSAKELTSKHLIKSLTLSKLLTKINNKIEEFHRRDLEYKQNLMNNNNDETSDEKLKKLYTVTPFVSNNLFNSQLTVDLFEFYDELEQDLADYFRYHPLFYYRKDLRKTAKRLLTCCSVISQIPASLIYDRKKRSQVIAKSLNSPTISFPFSIINQVDCRPYTDVVIPFKYLNEGISTCSVYLPRQYKFLLNDLNSCLNTDDDYLTINNNWSYNLLKTSPTAKHDKIRVRIIKDKTSIKNKTVLFHVHGGAFVFHSPECHEIYSREFVKKIPETVLMSVSYQKGVEYPKGQQDVLDAYLWLISGLDEVAEVIGFHPEKIMLIGDSAGSYYSFSLMHLLMDFNKEIDQPLKYPDALFSFYGYYNLTTISPAIFMNCLDFFLPPSNIRIAFGSLIWGVEKPKFNKRVFLPWFSDKKERWYHGKDSKKINNEMVKIFDSVPYLSSIHHFDYDSLKIPLYIVTSDTDLCLDHNIDLANRWKGDVSLLVLENGLIHGFLQLEAGASSIRQDMDKCFDLLRSAFDRL